MKGKKRLYVAVVTIIVIAAALDILFKGLGYQEHPELFTSETLAHAKLEEIQKIIQSKEYQEHPEMFTSTTLAHAKLEEIQKIIQSKEYQEHPELFTSTTLAHAKLEEIKELLKMVTLDK